VPNQAMTFSELSGDSLLPNRRKHGADAEKEKERTEQENFLAARSVNRWAKQTNASEEEKCKILEVLGLE